MTTNRCCVFAVALAALAPAAHAQDCTPQWLNQFRIADVDATIWDSIVVDDEDGQSLYITGDFYDAGEFESIGIARWTPSGFVSMNPTQTAIGGRCVAYLDLDGAGPGEAQLVAGGDTIQVWDGVSWTKIADAFGGKVFSLAMFDDGTGPALWAGGTMWKIATPNESYIEVNGLAKWDGTSWHAMTAPHFSGFVYSMLTYDDGSGPTLYIGGTISLENDTPIAALAKWTGSAFTTVGQPDWLDSFGGSGWIQTMRALDLGNGPRLYVGGHFNTVGGGVGANNVAVWNGSAFAPLGAGANKDVYDLVGFDDGTGLALYAAGAFTLVDGESIRGTAKWDGTGWDLAGSKVFGTARTLAVYEEDADPTLYVGGQFTNPAKNIARLTDTGWEPLGAGVNGPVFAMKTLDTGSGPAVYAGGEFTTVDGGTLPALNVARFDGTNWTALGGGLTGSPADFEVFNDGTGPAVYAAGFLTKAGGLTVSHIARWNGSAWSGVGTGLNQASYAACTFNDGSGNALYVGGDFTTAGGNSASHVARWNGSVWSSVGAGLDGSVVALTVFDDGAGPRLFAAGGFTGRVAAWNGSDWQSIPEPSHTVQAIAVFNDGSGPALYLAGWANHAEVNVSKWNGAQLTTLPAWTNDTIERLLAVTDEVGPALYAAGTFTTAGGVAAAHVARWDGSSWSPLDSGLTNYKGTYGGFGLASLTDFLGTTVFVGSSYTASGGISAGRFARWGCAASNNTPEKILISFTGNTIVPGIGTARNEDIVQYDPAAGKWSFVFDGSDVGLGPATIDALAVLSVPNKQILLSFTAPININGLVGGPNGTLVDDSDIVLFTANSLGPVTSGTFSFYFDGSDVGLDLDAEDIDALAVTPEGDLLISTLGNPVVPGVAGARDEDLLRFHPSSLGANTAGTWSMEFDGSDVGLATTSVEDVDAVALSSSGDLILSTLGDFAVQGAVGSSEDLLQFTPATLGANTTGTFAIFETLHLLGIDPAKNVGGLELTTGGLGRPGGPPPCYADLTDDEELDLFDYLAFQDLFAAADLRADCDHSTGPGVLDIFDFLCFQSAFNQGCE